MLATQYIMALATCISYALAFSLQEDFTTTLLKRQAPGTPAYDCHLNCGTAITIGRASSDPCTNSTFLSDYSACLECAGPSNQDIWQYYGTTLTTYAEGCGLSTTPVSNTTSSSGSNSTASVTASSSPTPASTVSASTTEAASSSATASPTASNTTVAVTGVGNTVNGHFHGVFVLVLAGIFASFV